MLSVTGNNRLDDSFGGRFRLENVHRTCCGRRTPPSVRVVGQLRTLGDDDGDDAWMTEADRRRDDVGHASRALLGRRRAFCNIIRRLS